MKGNHKKTTTRSQKESKTKQKTERKVQTNKILEQGNG
jgi:hypothetical protein